MNTKIFTKNELSEAAALIRNGGIVAMPTETVYGLAANAFDENAVQKIFDAKGRQSDNPLIVHIANISDWRKIVEDIPPKAQLLAERFWPGPLTIILKKKSIVPDIVSGGLDTVAVRMPKNKISFRFIKECGVPLAAPSANLSGAPSPTKFSHVYDDMNGRIDGIIDGGDCMVGLESTVISLAGDTPVILRPGRITAEQISRVIGEVEIHHTVTEALAQDETAASPGMKYKHYSPKAQVQIVDADSSEYVKFIKENADSKTAVICFSEQEPELSNFKTFSLGPSDDAVSHAKKLFDILRAIDEEGLEKAFSPMPPVSGVDLAVTNRLLRAAGFNVINLKSSKNISSELVSKKSADENKPEVKPVKKEQKTEPDSESVEIIGLEQNSTKAGSVSKETADSESDPSDSFNVLEVDSGRVVNNLSAYEEDSAILALNDVKFSADFDEDFSKEISDNITIIEKTEGDDPTKIFYEAVLSSEGAKPAEYPVDSIGDDFKFDVYDDDEPKRKGLFSFFSRKKNQDDEEPEPFIEPRDPIWDPAKPVQNRRIKAADYPTKRTKRQSEKSPAKKESKKIPGIRVIGLTGKSGSGKSYIANAMSEKTENSLVIDADALYHSMLSTDSMILNIVIAFGSDVLDNNKKIDRKKLAELAFSSEENLEKLNKAVLPSVAAEVINQIQKAKNRGIKTVFLDAPTLIESGLNEICDEIIFVTADAAIRQERIVARDNLTLDETGQRMRFEKEDEFYIRNSDRIIRNN